MNRGILLIGAGILIVIAGVFLWPKLGETPTGMPHTTSTIPPNSTGEEPVMCTMDAKMCPDGSYVGRTGPKCEFAPCPGDGVIRPIEGMDTWLATTTKSGISFHYPKDFGLEYVHVVDWPPVLNVSKNPYSCSPAGTEIARGGKTDIRVVNNREYCRTVVSEGAAGSVYTEFTYMTLWEGKNVILTFTTRKPQCANYDEPQKTNCTNEQTIFDVDQVVDQMVGTMKVEIR